MDVSLLFITLSLTLFTLSFIDLTMEESKIISSLFISLTFHEYKANDYKDLKKSYIYINQSS